MNQKKSNEISQIRFFDGQLHFFLSLFSCSRALQYPLYNTPIISINEMDALVALLGAS